MLSAKQTSRSETAIVNLATSALAWGWPVILAFVATPIIVSGLGNDAYGIRGLVTSITGYFALLDLGLNGAVTKYLAEYHAKNDGPQVEELLGTTLTTYTAFGLAGGVSIWLLAGWFTTHLFVIPPEFNNQAVWAFRLTGIGFFLSMITWWASAIPTGIQRFDVFNGISIGFGTMAILGSLAAVYLGYGLIGVVAANLLANLITILVYWLYLGKLLPGISVRFSFDREMFRRTVMFGLYMVGFRIFALLFAQLDSMLIGAWIGTAAVTFYIVPQQVAQVVHGINGKMMQVVFPMASEFSAKGDAQRMERLFVRGFNLSLVIGFAIAVPLAVVGGPLLTYWVSPEMAKNSTLVLELLIVTFFLGGLTAMPTNILCGINHPKYITIGAMVSGLLGLALYFLLIKPFGIAGVAAGKALSVAITVIYYLMICHIKSGYSIRTVFLDSLRTFGLAVAVGLPAYLFLAPLTRNLFEVFLLASVVGLTYCAACWCFGVIDSDEKRSLKAVVSRFAPKAFAS